MSGGNAVAVVISLAAGLGGSVQAAIVGKLGDRIGSIEALGFSMLLAGLTGTALLLVARQSLGGVATGFRQPVWLWAGGVLSAVIVLSLTIATPRIGVTAVIGLLIGGQLAMAAVIDRLGLFGFDRVALHWPRVLGIVLLATGAALSLRK
ncbi:MAG TPA: DMT family transporter [Gaiellaceae bacterium]|nr:DMT family transporter [Gaiellaceae bacterium]